MLGDEKKSIAIIRVCKNMRLYAKIAEIFLKKGSYTKEN